jgi:hypothetical protein
LVVPNLDHGADVFRVPAIRSRVGRVRLVSIDTTSLAATGGTVAVGLRTVDGAIGSSGTQLAKVDRAGGKKQGCDMGDHCESD